MFKKIVYVVAAAQIASGSSAYASQDAIAEYEAAFSNPAYVHLELPANDINHTLSLQSDEKYGNRRLTAQQVWDAEKRKAWDPVTYIPHAVLAGKSYDKAIGAQGEETFMRTCQQRSWLDPSKTADVLEEVHVFENQRKVIFLGRPVINPTNGNVQQALFHVEHAVGGDEENPTNLWRIVFLTDDKNYPEKLAERLSALPKGSIPMFIKQYIDHVSIKGEEK